MTADSVVLDEAVASAGHPLACCRKAWRRP
jgi:hypothetical protein